MRNLLVHWLFLLPCLLPAGTVTPIVKTHSLDSAAVHTFYSTYHLNPDSAVSPDLYYLVYDWNGTRYKYAGHSKSGIDCSGFVSEMYRNVYCIQLCGGAKNIFTQVDTVARNQMQEGDILFFKIKKGQISHVGIYLGNNKFAHASVHGGVMIDDLDEPYYHKFFYRAGRVKKQ